MKLTKKSRFIWTAVAILMVLSLVVAPFLMMLNAS